MVERRRRERVDSVVVGIGVVVGFVVGVLAICETGREGMRQRHAFPRYGLGRPCGWSRVRQSIGMTSFEV